MRSYHLIHWNRAVCQRKGSNSCADPVVSVEALAQPFVCTNRDCTNSVDVFFFAASACLASIADDAPYCCRGEAWEMHRRCAAPLCNRTRDLVTGRRAVTRAEILLLTSIHEDAMLESFIGDRSEMVKCWIEKLEGNLYMDEMGLRIWRLLCMHARQGSNSRIPTHQLRDPYALLSFPSCWRGRIVQGSDINAIARPESFELVNGGK